VYGDTDSVFVLLAGSSKERAFHVGKEIADVITKRNPNPMKLKFEKVYHPCVLQSKKRYVGFKYESPDQVDPEFDAKGIETVRRDGCPAVAKIMEQSLKFVYKLIMLKYRILFRTSDVSQVKTYVERQWTKIMLGRVNIQDFIFAKEVKLDTYRYLSAIGCIMRVKTGFHHRAQH
jgi:DNA polymerase zeta